MKSIERLCMILVIALSVSHGALAQNQGPLDINGKWKTGDGDLVIVSQSGQSLTATFVSGGQCPYGGARSYYIQGSLKGNSLTGDMQRCTRNKKLLNDCGLMDPHSVKFKATVTTTTISGTYRADYINYDEENGRFTNCRTTTGGGGEGDISLTRECTPNKGGACMGIGQAIQTLAAAKQKPGSAGLYKSLQQNLGAQLGQLRNDLCDDKTGTQQIADVQKALDSLNYVPGQSNTQNNLALLHIEDGLGGLNQAKCGAAPSQNKFCPGGEKKADASDEEAAKFVKEKFKEALDKVKETAREMQDHGATVPQQISDQIKNLKKAVDFWDQIKAGSCVPPDVLQTMQQVMNDRRAAGYSENCFSMCRALKTWYERLIGQSNSVQGKLFMDDCLARCN